MTRMRLTVMFEAGASGSLGERGTGAALEDMVRQCLSAHDAALREQSVVGAAANQAITSD